MNRAHRFSAIRPICAMGFLALFLTTGCASFRSQTVQPASGWPPASSKDIDSRPVAFMRVRATMQDNVMSRKPTEVAAQADFLRAIASRTARESSLFKRVGFDAATEAKADYKITAEVAAKANAGMGTIAWAGLCGASLFIIPCTFTESLTFTGQVQDRSGTELARFEYREDIRTWFHLFMLPLFGKRPETVYDAVKEDMFKCFFQDMKSRGTLGD